MTGMTKTLKTIQKTPDIPQLVADQIIEQISKGILKPGTKLPSEIQMTEDFGISRISLREAMKLLEAKGYIESMGRKGKFIRSLADSSLKEPIEEMISIDHDKIWELLAVRRIMDSEAAALAAENASDTQLKDFEEEVKVKLDKLKKSGSMDQKESGRIYNDLYMKIAELTNNTIFYHVMKSIHSILRGSLPYSREKLKDLDGVFEDFIQQHTDIIGHIFAREPKKAHDAVKTHIDWLEEKLKTVLKDENS